MNAAEDVGTEPRSGRAVVIVIGLVAAAIALYFALGMPGMDHSPSTTGTDHEQMDM